MIIIIISISISSSISIIIIIIIIIISSSSSSSSGCDRARDAARTTQGGLGLHKDVRHVLVLSQTCCVLFVC